MVNINTIIYVAKSLHSEDVKNKKVLEIGSLDHNGTVRGLFESFSPQKYVGIDFMNGPGVDVVCRAEDLISTFGVNSFDIVVATEVLQHTKNWKEVIHNMKLVCKEGGEILISARSKGFLGYHGYPQDFWRYDVEDINEIFSDFNIISLEKDRFEDGILVKMKKPSHFVENDLSQYELYSIVTARRVAQLNDKDLNNIYYKLMGVRYKLNKFILKVGRKLLN